MVFWASTVPANLPAPSGSTRSLEGCPPGEGDVDTALPCLVCPSCGRYAGTRRLEPIKAGELPRRWGYITWDGGIFIHKTMMFKSTHNLQDHSCCQVQVKMIAPKWMVNDGYILGCPMVP